jgi:N-acetylglucosamine-6-phosphate deacetylase
VRLRSQRIVTPGGTIAGEVEIDETAIVAVTPAPASGRPPAPAGPAAVTDLGDRWLVPGFVDGHVHAGGGAQFNTTDPDEIATAVRCHLRHGTTALLATTVAAPVSELRAAIAALAAWRDRSRRPEARALVGLHLEGPFISPHRPGAMDPEAFADPHPETVDRLLSAAGSQLVQMTLAPERPGGLDLVARLSRHGILASIGHSDADEAQVSAAVRAGARSATHVFNAMAPLHHRAPGLLGAVLDTPELNCELICDGMHVAPTAMRLVHRIKGLSGMRLVTDAMAAAGMPDGEYRLGRAPVRVTEGRAVLIEGGSLAGSTLTMDRAVANAVSLVGLSVPEAIQLAATVPARLLGLGARKGAIAVGRDADLAVLDDELCCVGTILGGGWAHGTPEALVRAA